MNYPGMNYPGMNYQGMYYPQMSYRDYLVYLMEQNNYMLYEMKIRIDEIYDQVNKDRTFLSTVPAQTPVPVELPEQAPELTKAVMPKIEGQRGAVEVRIEDKVFSPSVLTVNKGTTVVWSNNDLTEHTVTAQNEDFDSDTLKPGQSYSRTLYKPGTYSYFSSKDPIVRGTIQVL